MNNAQTPSDDLRAWLDSLPEGPPWTADDPDPLIRKAVQSGFTMARPLNPLEMPMTHKDMSTQEEARMSTPYSDLATWRRILIYQLRLGESRFRGPPGLLEKLAARLGCPMKPGTTLPPST